MQFVADAQETAPRELLRLPAGTGTGWSDQALPFQDQACSEEAFVYPTAAQLAAVAQETPSSWALVAPGGDGTGWIVHELAALAAPGAYTARAAAAIMMARLRRLIPLPFAGTLAAPQE